MQFRIIDSNQEPLEVIGAHQERFWHLATIHYGSREFMFYADILADLSDIKGSPIKVYIEEIVGGHLEWIKDEKLWEDINNFLVAQGLNSDKMLHFLNAHRTRVLEKLKGGAR